MVRPKRTAALRAGVVAALAAASATAAGCGGQSADLFAVQRTGTVPGAKLTLVVNDGGAVRCGQASSARLTSGLLLEARQMQRDLAVPAQRRVSLPPGPNAVLTYVVDTPDGTVRFSDSSPRIGPVFQRLAFLVRRLAQGPCHLSR
jgi:hypothetical protein